MHLKSIEIVGFKSFADKTTIHLDSGFTAIVGPNGSGKSNITEAIKWVLGEQSAKSLRGRKMDDVIFSGASNRKKSHYAQVTLVFDNSDRLLNMDTDEVSMTRRYTRAGESTYMINRRQCRLKDMTELMMDTGIGRDSFSIISQGQVEAIFTQKPEERRGIFEEAAGVIKYKNRKKEAERKLTHTEEGLNRIYDILQEVEGRLEPLERQRDAAVAYQTKRQALSEVEIALTAVQIETLNDQWEVAKRDLASYVETIQIKKASQNETDAKLQAFREEETKEDEKANQLSEDYIALVRKAEQVKREIDLLTQQQTFDQRDRASQEETLVQYETQIQQLKKAVTVLDAKVHDAKLEVSDKEAARDAILTQLQAVSENNSAQIEAKRQTYIDAIQEQSRLKNQLTQLEKEQQQLTYQAQQFKTHADSHTTEQEELIVAYEKKQAEKATQSAILEQLLKDYQETVQTLKTKKTEQQEQQLQLQRQQQQLMQAQARKDGLVSLEREHTGFYFGVRNALKMQAKITGIHGAVADLLTVPEQYVGAVETALGSAMQQIITADRKTASQVITALKQQRGGRATFLPLDVIKPRQLPQQVLQKIAHLSGFIGPMSQLVQYDAQFTNVMENLMGQTLVVDNLAHAQVIAQAVNQRYRIVTLESDIIHAGGSMSGGASKHKQDGILSRKQELDQLTTKIQALTTTEEKLKIQLAKIQAVYAELQATLDEQKATGDDARFKERTLAQEVEQLATKMREVEKEVKAQAYEQRVNQEDLAQVATDLEATKAALTTQASTVEDLQTTIQNLSLSASEKQEKREEWQQKLQASKTDLAVFNEQLKQQQSQLKQQQADLKQQQQAYRQLQVHLKEKANQMASDTASTTDLQQQYDQLLADQKASKKALKTARQSRQEAQQQAKELEAESNTIASALEELYYKQAKLEGTVSRYEVSIDNHLEHLREEYGLTYERAREQSELTLSMEAAAQKVRELKQEIDQIGPVNVNAIAEYEEVFERYTFMTAQRDDILAAKENLELTMAEMDKEVTYRFEETFTAVREAFERIFPKLFGGGQASLSLTDPSDLLHSGVDIVAQPPGKRLQHLSLLSGGEKALTAIALLFAILDVKRDIPFSILDEVEAALDEANVVRYGRYLREFAKTTQFIVITHRKGTMEEANVLYGVTMQQSGVSKLASVRLEDFDETE